MRRLVPVVGICAFVLFPTLHAQQPAVSQLPVRRVVLYKNGVGYFEHVGRVRGTQSLAIDFNSAQLNDVLKSLTTIDLGNGRIENVSFNSQAPLAQRLGGLSLPVGEGTTLIDLLRVLKGARIEVRTGERVVAGRLLSVERRPRGKDEAPRDELSLVTDGGTMRTVELTTSTGVRLLERDLADQVGAYLSLIGSNRSQDRRRMTIAAAGTGERDVLVSYISEVPVWKTTYRIVLPSDEGGQPQLQGWAIVDNTIGEDWGGVELSLVAGAPQSFIQQLSQPLYVRRPVIDIARAASTTPQVHEAPMSASEASKTIGDVSNAYARGSVGGVGGGIVGGRAEAPAPPPPPAAPIDRLALERRIADMQTAAQGQNLGDLFEYHVTGPISIRKNESALVPILNAPVAVERVSLWNDRVGGARPLRSLWLTNSSRLTLDAGSFTVLDDATFAGEGLVEPIRPGEKRLLSYAIDLGVQVESKNGDSANDVRRVRIERGVVIEQREQRTRKVYTIRNNDATPRTVVIEHPVRPGWELAGDVKPAETSLTMYRFAVPVAAKNTAKITVDERHPLEARYTITDLTDERLVVFLRESRDNDRLRQALRPIQAAKALLASLTNDLSAREAAVKTIADDQERVRENMRSLKNSADEHQLLKRYVAQLNEAEDRLSTLRREITNLRDQRQRAAEDLVRQIEALSLEVEVA
jgi:hypothetical protein